MGLQREKTWETVLIFTIFQADTQYQMQTAANYKRKALKNVQTSQYSCDKLISIVLLSYN